MNESTVHGAFWGSIVLLILLLFQFFMFAFLPAIDPNIPDNLQKSEAIAFILKKDLIVFIQSVVVIGILFLINKRLFRIGLRTCFVIALVEILVLVTSMLFFSLHYVNKYPLHY